MKELTIFKICQGPQCHTVRYYRQIKRNKRKQKTYQTRRRSGRYIMVNGNFCTLNCHGTIGCEITWNKSS